METWRLYKFDVWGNESEGYEVNDVLRTGDYVTVDSGATTDQIIAELEKQCIITNTESFEITDDQEGVIYFDNKKDGRPIGKIEKEEK